jgi:hypothetical protein
MSLPSHLARVTVDRIIDFIVPLLLTTACGDGEAARQAAMEMLADFLPHTAEELSLAAEVIAFRLKALEMLHDSTVPGTPKATVMELLKVANTLRRSEAGAQRKLDSLQRPRRAATKNQAKAAAPTPQPPVPAPPKPPAQTPVAQEPSAQTLVAQALAAQSKPPHAAAMPPASPSRADTRVQRVTAGLTGPNRNQPEPDDMLANIAAAYSRGDHRGVANAIVGTAATAASTSALLGMRA